MNLQPHPRPIIMGEQIPFEPNLINLFNSDLLEDLNMVSAGNPICEPQVPI